MPNGTCIYNADGASRRQSGVRLASCGVVLRIDGHVVSRYGEFLDDATNNVAEYTGAQRALAHIAYMVQACECRRILLRLDSLLIVRQLNGEWACRCQHLRIYYEDCLCRIRSIRGNACCEEFRIEHVYREYNADADGTANEAIDVRAATDPAGTVTVTMNWQPTHVTMEVRCNLSKPGRHNLDADGDVNMQEAYACADSDGDNSSQDLHSDYEGDVLMEYMLAQAE